MIISALFAVTQTVWMHLQIQCIGIYSYQMICRHEQINFITASEGLLKKNKKIKKKKSSLLMLFRRLRSKYVIIKWRIIFFSILLLMKFLLYKGTLLLWSKGTDVCEVTWSTCGVCSFFDKLLNFTVIRRADFFIVFEKARNIPKNYNCDQVCFLYQETGGTSTEEKTTSIYIDSKLRDSHQ